MRPSLQAECEKLIANQQILKKVGFFGNPTLLKLGALLCVDNDVTPNPEKIKQCRMLLKRNTGLFSNFRGTLQGIIPIKMSFADDPEEYLADALYIYEGLKKGRVFSGEMIAMTALAIADICPRARYDEVVAAARDAYARIGKEHPFLTNDYDMTLIALTCIVSSESEDVPERTEEAFRVLRSFGVPGEAAQSAAMMLGLSDRSLDEKVELFIETYQALKDAGHATPRDESMAIYASFVDSGKQLEQIVFDVSEVDDWLKGQRGYRFMGLGSKLRRLFAAALVLKDYEGGFGGAATITSASTVTEAVVEQVVLTVSMIMILSATNASTALANTR